MITLALSKGRIFDETLPLLAAAGIEVTDEAMAMERLGLRPGLVEGAEDNLKITTPADLALAEFLLARGLHQA